MKVLHEIKEVENEGLLSLIGQRVTIFSAVYIYTGKLVAVNEYCVKLQDASIVYETGAFADAEWEDAQALPGDWYVAASMIESFGILK